MKGTYPHQSSVTNIPTRFSYLEKAGDEDVSTPNFDIVERISQLKKEKAELLALLQETQNKHDKHVRDLEEQHRLQLEQLKRQPTTNKYICEACSRQRIHTNSSPQTGHQRRTESTRSGKEKGEEEGEDEEGGLVDPRRKRNNGVSPTRGNYNSTNNNNHYTTTNHKSMQEEVNRLEKEKQALVNKLVALTQRLSACTLYNTELEKIVHSYALLSHLAVDTLMPATTQETEPSDHAPSYDSSLLASFDEYDRRRVDLSFEDLRARVWPRLQQVQGISRLDPDRSVGTTVLFPELITPELN